MDPLRKDTCSAWSEWEITARQERLKYYSLVEDSDLRKVKKIVQIRGAQHIHVSLWQGVHST